ncbi:FAD-binding oxidoreductase [Streptomyces sp. GbtcB7]|uniref:FAD-binding oxidoreductase n=1 Tax=Streptomyces sp. GbtcB7 TaxID=2824752 RepID=UPI0020C711BB|nr:FAD-binding oxidoreductase [Streptomyces sp. GbtcB7]
MTQVALSTAALDALTAALGPEHVLHRPEDLLPYRDPYSHASWQEHTPSAVVSPGTVEEVQAVVRIAGEHRLPLWTFSQGRNNGYGGPAPATAGSVSVSLRRMDRILELDEDLAYCVVEPGVRFFDLFEEIRRRGLALWPSIPDLGWGSVVGNCLDHGVGFTPLGDHPGRQCGMEVVLADGSLLRTGMGAMEGNTSWALRKFGFGPTADGMFMQSNYGIVTTMGCWLVPRPEVYMSCDVRVEHEEDIVALIDTVRPLLLDRTIPNYPIAYNTMLVGGALSGVPREHWYDGEGPLPEEAIDRMARETDAGRWYMRFALYGHAEIVEQQYAACRRAFEAIPGARVTARTYDGATVVDRLTAPTEPVPDSPAAALPRIRHQSDTTQAGIPTLDLLDNLSWDEHGVGGHLDYSPVAPLTGTEALEQSRWLRAALAAEGLDYAASLMLTPRAFVNITSVWFDTADEAQTRHAYDVIGRLVPEGARRGYGVYRTHLRHMDAVADTFDYADHALRRFNETVKDCLDPHGILSPGKQGIRPRALR